MVIVISLIVVFVIAVAAEFTVSADQPNSHFIHDLSQVVWQSILPLKINNLFVFFLFFKEKKK